MSILEVKNLNVAFKSDEKSYQALYNVSFNLNEGKTLALVGESGCGKTLTAMSILRLLPKNAYVMSGEILYNKMDILKTEHPEKIRGTKIALIPQDPMTSLNPLYTVENQLVEVINKNKLFSKADTLKKAKEALDKVKIPNVEEKLKAYPHELSGGMKQRVIIAMALACNAEIIIADEPTTALDVTIQAQIMNLLNTIKRELRTSILFISHDLELVGQYCDDIAVMYAGSIVEKAPVKEFFDCTLHPYSIALLKTRPRGNAKRLKIIEGQPPSIKDCISGCKFHPRCTSSTSESCKKVVPEQYMSKVSENHMVACHLGDWGRLIGRFD
ncbi:ABC transporter ATP-binding protein [bacterium]|nr:ABC transporter ATP-binding protein [bacterium]